MRRDARRLATAIQYANRNILKSAAEDEARKGMGTTIVAVLMSPTSGVLTLGHVGDSRCYRLRDGHLELLTIEFWTQVIVTVKLPRSERKPAGRALLNEQEHLAAVSQILTGAGQTAPTADDFDLTFPDGTFSNRATILGAAAALETIALGVYLGAVDALAAGDLRTAAARIAASEAQHLGFASGALHGRPIGISFPTPLDEAAASNALAPYLQTAG